MLSQSTASPLYFQIYYLWFWPSAVKKNNFTIRINFKNKNVKFPCAFPQLSAHGEAFSWSCVIVSSVEIIVWPVQCFPALHFVKICLPKSKWCPEKQGKSELKCWSEKSEVCREVACLYWELGGGIGKANLGFGEQYWLSAVAIFASWVFCT
jgi:hypothetical protein